jgi:hypothetical protein
MGREEGFLFGYPGLRSVTVPYHDTNDFFFSGHVGTCLLVVLEYRASGWFKMSYVTTFILINQWIMLTLVRTHYVIDLVTGLVVAHYMFMMAEQIIFIADVKILGLPGHKRSRFWYKPCQCCGWSNKYAGDYMAKEEKDQLKKLYRGDQKHHLLDNKSNMHSSSAVAVDDEVFAQAKK